MYGRLLEDRSPHGTKSTFELPEYLKNRESETKTISTRPRPQDETKVAGLDPLSMSSEHGTEDILENATLARRTSLRFDEFEGCI